MPASCWQAEPTCRKRRRWTALYPQSNYYFYVEDAEALRQAVVDRGWQATECVKRFYGLLEFEVVDPDGHVLLFGQDLEDIEAAS